MGKATFVVIGILVVLIFLNSIMYTIHEGYQVVVTQFGKPVCIVKEAGLHFKKPIIHQVNYFEKRLLEWDGRPEEIPTLDKTRIVVDTFARWKIEDPLKFFQTVRDERSAQGRLDTIIDGAVRSQISNNLLIETVRNSNRTMETIITKGEERGIVEVPTIREGKGRNELNSLILAEAIPSAEKLGIKLVDVRIKRINYVRDVREAVYQRMIAERKQIATKHRSEGTGEMKAIMGEKELREKEIRSEAYKHAQEIKGKADAEAITIYAEAYSKDPEFYSFLKTLETYEKTLGAKSIIVLSTDTDYFKYLKSASEKD